MVQDATVDTPKSRWHESTGEGAWPNVAAKVGCIAVPAVGIMPVQTAKAGSAAAAPKAAPPAVAAPAVAAPGRAAAEPRSGRVATVDTPRNRWHEGAGEAAWPGVAARVGCMVVPAAGVMPTQTAKAAPAAAAPKAAPAAATAPAARARPWYEGAASGTFSGVGGPVGIMPIQAAAAKAPMDAAQKGAPTPEPEAETTRLQASVGETVDVEAERGGWE